MSKVLCRGCLSLDRDVAPLGDLSDLFFKLSKLKSSEYSLIKLCWECRSILRKTYRFQQRILNAQLLLKQTHSHLNNSKAFTLSTLSTVLNNKIIIIQENCVEEFEQNVELKIERNGDNVDYKIYDDKLNESTYSDDEISELKQEITELKEEIDTDIKVINTTKVNLKDDKRHYKYKKHAVMTANSFDYNNFFRYFIKNNLNEKVIEEVLNRRMSIMHKKVPYYVCKVCGTGFQKNIDLKRHKVIRHPPPMGPYKCSECQNSGSIPTLKDLQAHWESHYVYKCKLCPEVCRSTVEANRHLLQVHQYTYQCIECRKTFDAYREFYRHYKDLHERMVCDHCGKSFIKKKTLETHIKRKHLPPICYTCGRVYKSVHALESHSRLSHPELHYDLSKTELSYCVECNKQFNSVYTYRRHLSTAYIHRPPKPVSIPCPDCGKVFSRKIYMNNHYKLFHMKKSRHHCEVCDKYYVTAYALRNHRLRVHEKTYPPKDKICEICGRGFSTNRVLIHHRRTHTGEKPHKCSQCPAAFAQLCAKKSHERSQHKIG